MKILIAPLNWGLGHASRCIPLIIRFLKEGHEVVLAGDGDSLRLLRKRFPALSTYPAASLRLHYSRSNRQTGAILRALPRLIRFAIADHRALRAILAIEQFDWVVSDNRFGFFTADAHTIYITHQLHIPLPNGWQWAEGLAERLHACIWRQYDQVWVPDDESHRLSGRLSCLTGTHPPKQLRYIGALSRFADTQATTPADPYEVVAVLSGLEPQRALLEKHLVQEYMQQGKRILIVRGKVGQPPTELQKRTPSGGLITIVPHLADAVLKGYLMAADKIICRSGYSSIMDIDALGLQDKTTFIATPGQPEQEYLESIIKSNNQNIPKT